MNSREKLEDDAHDLYHENCVLTAERDLLYSIVKGRLPELRRVRALVDAEIMELDALDDDLEALDYRKPSKSPHLCEGCKEQIQLTDDQLKDSMSCFDGIYCDDCRKEIKTAPDPLEDSGVRDLYGYDKY